MGAVPQTPPYTGSTVSFPVASPKKNSENDDNKVSQTLFTWVFMEACFRHRMKNKKGNCDL